MSKAKTSLYLPDDFIGLDLETTGLDAQQCEIIEVAIAVVENRKIVRRASTLVKPNDPIPAFITAITGINDAMVADAPSIGDVIGDLAGIIRGSVLVGHNVCFDDRFLQAAFSRAGIDCRCTLVDTLRMSRHVLKSLTHKDHDSVAIACGLSVDELDRHRAAHDAELAALSAIAMWPLIKERYGDDPDSYVARHPDGVRPIDLKPTVDEIDESNPFYGSNILFTGTLDGMTRAEAMQKAVNLGATPLKGFSKKVDYLVVGSFDFNSSLHGEPSSKLKKAREAIAAGSSMQIVSESFFAEFASEV